MCCTSKKRGGEIFLVKKIFLIEKKLLTTVVVESVPAAVGKVPVRKGFEICGQALVLLKNAIATKYCY